MRLLHKFTDRLRGLKQNNTNTLGVILVSLILLTAGTIGVTRAWYGRSVNVTPSVQQINSASAGENLDVGHDTFKFDPDADKGIQVLGAETIMNRYDKVFSSRNADTPIILRAILDPSWNEKAVNGKLTLQVSCGSNSLFRDGYDRDSNKERDRDENGAYVNQPEDLPRDEKNGALSDSGTLDGIIDYLSNVVNFRVAYIPRLASSAEEGNFMPLISGASTTYADANDYIYKYAVDYIENSGAAAIDFWKTTGADVPEHDVEADPVIKYIITEITDSSQIDVLTKKPTVQNGNSRTDYEYSIEGYLIANAGGNVVMTPDPATGGNSATLQSFALDIQTGVELDAPISEKYLWLLSGASTSIQNKGNRQYLTVTRSGNWLSGYQYALTMTNTTSTWNIANDMRFTTTNFGLNYSGSTFSGAAQNNAANLKLYKVEKQISKTTTTIPATHATNDKILTIDLDLEGARDPESGYYYVYVMIDYDKKNIDSYIRMNGLSWTIGSTGDVDFKDNFRFSIVTETQ